MPYSTLELNAANKAEAVAARTATKNARAAILRARWLRLGGEPAAWDVAETDLLKRDLEARLLDSAGRSFDPGPDLPTPETSLT